MRQESFAYYELRECHPTKGPSAGAVLISIRVRAADCDVPVEIKAGWVPGKTAICWRADMALPRRISSESLASVRQKRLVRRVEKKYPLFAGQFIEREMADRPGFFAGERS